VDLKGDERKKFIGSSLLFVITFGLVLIVLITVRGQYLISALFPKSNISFYPLFAISLGIMFFTIPQQIVNAIFRIKEKPKYILFLVIFSSTTMAIFITLFLVILRQGLRGLLTGQLIATFLIFWAYFYIIRKEYLLKFEWKLFKPALFFSLPLIPYLFLDFIRSRAGIYILEKFVETGKIGIYFFGANIGFAMSAIVSTFAAAYSPRMFNLLKEEPLNKVKEEFKKIFLYIYLLMLTGFAFICLFSEEVIILFFSEMYYDSYTIVPIITLSCFLGGVYLFFHNSFYWTKKTHYVSLSAFIMAAITILAQVILIPRLGITGAALGLLIGQISGLISGYIWGQKVFPMIYNFNKLAFISIFAILSVFVIGYLLPSGLIIWKIAIKLAAILLLIKMVLAIGKIDFKAGLNIYRDLLKSS